MYYITSDPMTHRISVWSIILTVFLVFFGSLILSTLTDLDIRASLGLVSMLGVLMWLRQNM